MAKDYYEALQEAQQSTHKSVGAKLSVHQEDGTVFYGYGNLFYYPDLNTVPSPYRPSLPGGQPTAYVPTEGLSSRTNDSFKVLSSAAYDTNAPGPWANEYQSFILSVADLIGVTIYETRSIPSRSQRSLILEIDVTPYQRGLGLTVEGIGKLVRGVGSAFTDTNQQATYTLSFGPRYEGIF